MPDKDALPTDVATIEAELFSISQLAYLGTLHDEMMRRAGLGLDRAVFPTLQLIDRLPHPRASVIADELRVTRPTISRRIQQLERHGLVERESRSDDKRVSDLRLTPAGMQALRDIGEARRAMIREMVEGWNKHELAQLEESLTRLNACFLEYANRFRTNHP